MTICISVKVNEGLVLAADSTVAIQGSVDGKNVILQTYEHARKVSQIKDYPIGTLTWGLGHIGNRTVESLIKEYEYSLPSVEEEREKSKEQRMRDEGGASEYPFNVKEIADGLRTHISQWYCQEWPKTDTTQGQSLGILVSGYSTNQFFPEQWLIDFPGSADNITQVRADVNGKPDFGANWFGITDAIVRLHWGRDDKAIPKIAQKFGGNEQEIFSLLMDLQYQIPFEGMPLQDAIDYAVYLINVEIGRFRFCFGPPLCGGDIDVAVITPNAFHWIQRKAWKV